MTAGDDSPAMAPFSDLAAGLAGRINTLALTLDRLDRLESGSGDWLAGFAERELPAAAAEMVLRSLRTAADPVNYQLLTLLTAHNTLPLLQIMSATGLGRLVLSERLHDLAQVGLASRLIDSDHAQITAAGAEMAQFIERLVDIVRQDLSCRTWAR